MLAILGLCDEGGGGGGKNRAPKGASVLNNFAGGSELDGEGGDCPGLDMSSYETRIRALGSVSKRMAK